MTETAAGARADESVAGGLADNEPAGDGLANEVRANRGPAPEDQPRWLDAEERRLWIDLVGISILLPGAVEVELKRDAGLSFFEYHVLAMLSEAEGRTRLMSELALWANSSLSRLSHVVARLEKQGWVRREACATDGRATNAVLTDAGLEHLRAHAPRHVEEVRRIVFDRLAPGDVEQMSAGLGRIFESLSPEHR